MNPQAPLGSTKARARSRSRTHTHVGEKSAAVSDPPGRQRFLQRHHYGRTYLYTAVETKPVSSHFGAAALESIHWRGSTPAGLRHPQWVLAEAVIQFSIPGTAPESPVTCFCTSLSKVRQACFCAGFPAPPLLSLPLRGCLVTSFCRLLRTAGRQPITRPAFA